MTTWRADLPSSTPPRKGAGKGLVKRLRSTRAYVRTMRAWRAKHPICQRCGVRASTETHHHVPVHEAPELVLAWHNLLAVCHECHEAIHEEQRTATNPPPQTGPNQEGRRTAQVCE